MISVIIPVYNGAGTIGKMAQSLIAQTVQNFEVIFVNDGSTDTTGISCDRISERDNRFRCIHQENAGVSAARNRGMQVANGAYITFLDADDLIEPNYLEVLLDAIQADNADIAVCDIVVEQDGAVIRRFTLPQQTMTQTEAFNALFMRKDLNSGPCAKLFRREIVAGLEFPPMKAYEDVLFVKDAFRRAQKIAATDQTGYHYIQNGQGAMSSFQKMPSSDIVMATADLLDFICSRNNLSPSCFYITASHLMQYVQPLLDRPDTVGSDFIRSVQRLYRRYQWQIIKCSAFPVKERIVYLAFAYGMSYHCGKWSRIGV